MKGINKLRKFAKDFKGKTITDVIEVLYSVEVEDERNFEVFACVRKYHRDCHRVWIYDYDEKGGWQIGERTRDNAVGFLMMKDMENKYEIHDMSVSNYSKFLRVHITLIERGTERPE